MNSEEAHGRKVNRIRNRTFTKLIFLFARRLNDTILAYGIAYRFVVCFRGNEFREALTLVSKFPESNIKEKLLRLVDFCDAFLDDSDVPPLDNNNAS